MRKTKHRPAVIRSLVAGEPLCRCGRPWEECRPEMQQPAPGRDGLEGGRECRDMGSD
jgi:hypothetical protein